MKHYIVNSDRCAIVDETQAALQGFVQKPDYSEGFLVKNDDSHDYAEEIKKVVATWLAVDSYGRTSRKVFTGKNALENARKFRDTEWPEEGRVSTDGISRFTGFQYKH